MDKSNKLTVTANNIRSWGVSQKVSKRICSELASLGFWVSYKRSKYMINPRVLNHISTEQLPSLIGIYDNYKGKDVKFDAYIKGRKDFKEKMKAEKVIEIDVKKLYEETVNDEIREENKMNSSLIKSLTKQLDVKDKQIEMLMTLLTPEQLQKATPHLTLVQPK
jgi:hypothetical protein